MVSSAWLIILEPTQEPFKVCSLANRLVITTISSAVSDENLVDPSQRVFHYGFCSTNMAIVIYSLWNKCDPIFC